MDSHMHRPDWRSRILQSEAGRYNRTVGEGDLGLGV